MRAADQCRNTFSHQFGTSERCAPQTASSASTPHGLALVSDEKKPTLRQLDYATAEAQASARVDSSPTDISAGGFARAAAEGKACGVPAYADMHSLPADDKYKYEGQATIGSETPLTQTEELKAGVYAFRSAGSLAVGTVAMGIGAKSSLLAANKAKEETKLKNMDRPLQSPLPPATTHNTNGDAQVDDHERATATLNAPLPQGSKATDASDLPLEHFEQSSQSIRFTPRAAGAKTATPASIPESPRGLGDAAHRLDASATGIPMCVGVGSCTRLAQRKLHSSPSHLACFCCGATLSLAH